jgi:hypothetical protein
MCPRNTYESARRARKTQIFLFSRTRPISTCNNPYTIKMTTKSRTGQEEHEAGGQDEKLWATQTSAAEASTNRVNEKIVAARKTLNPEPSPLSVRKTAGGYEDFTRCRVEPIQAQGLKKRQRK